MTTRGAASIVVQSANQKLGHAAATYVSVEASCPKSCALYGKGCYAQLGRVGLFASRLDAAARGPVAAARDEAALIRGSVTEGRPLRLHVSGDCRTEQAAAIVADACLDWRRRRGGPVWTYTHGWRQVARRIWGIVSVLASIESTKEGKAALAAGYAPAVVVEKFPEGGKVFVRDGVQWTPCPEQTRGLSCTECRACFDSERLARKGIGIAFEAHSQRKKKLLVVLQGPLHGVDAVRAGRDEAAQ